MSELIPETAAVPEAPVATGLPLRWYVVHAYSGMEKAVERNIRERIERAGMHDKFGRILVPTEEVIELKNGKKSVTERRFFPGYVRVEMSMDDESVRVKEGPFTDFNGAVEDVNYEKSKVKVSVTIFGRATGVELDFAQVEKI